MRAAEALALGLLSAGLTGCYDELPNARLMNNAGRAIVLVEKAGADGARRIVIAPGATSSHVVAYGTGRRFDIIADACVYHYVFPLMGVNFAWRTPDGSQPDYSSHFPVLAQVEPDLRIFLRPQGAKGPSERRQLDAVQAHGFPLAPVGQTCADPTPPA